MRKDWKAYPWLRISLLLYLAACCSPALLFTTVARDSLTPVTHDTMWGFQVLLKGYLGIVLGIIAWYANPLWLAALLLARFQWLKAAFAVALASLVVALTTFLAIGKDLAVWASDQYHQHLSAPLPGCFLWIASLAAVPLACWLRITEQKGKLEGIRQLGLFAMIAAVAAPLLYAFLRFGPPPSGKVALVTSGLVLLAVMWTRHFWRGLARKNLKRRAWLCAALFVAGLVMSGVLLKRFTVRPNPGDDNFVEGYALRTDVQPLLGPGHTPADALREAQYDTGKVWTSESIAATHVLLVSCWVGTFVSAGMLISAFGMFHEQGPKPPLTPDGSETHLVPGPS